jgi:hypothetical protein
VRAAPPIVVAQLLRCAAALINAHRDAPCQWNILRLRLLKSS